MSHLTTAQKTNFIGYPKPAELIEITGSHLLDAPDRAIQNMIFQYAHDSGRLIEPDAEWELRFADIRKALSKHESNDAVRSSLDKLRRVEVTLHYLSSRTGKPRTLKTNLLEFTDTDDDNSDGATVMFGIPKKLRMALINSNRWGRVKSEITYAMTSKYAITLYEMVCLRANMDICVESFKIDRFRELLGVPPDSYKRGDDFRRFVVEPALLEVNGLSDLSVQIDLRRRHSRAPIHEVTMAWGKKCGDEFRAAQQERNRSKAGRMARLRGQVETTEPKPTI